VNFAIAPNSGSARTASLVIADQMAKVTQEANRRLIVLHADRGNVSAPASGTNASSGG
jgi:hypothetical protein